MKKILLVIYTAAVFAACAPQDYEPYATRGLYQPPKDYDQFKLERTACYGVCPVYEVIVNEKDILEFRGKRFVAEEGGAVGKRLADGSFDQLIEIAAEHEFQSFDAAYPNADVSNCPRMATDNPRVIITIKAKNSAKKVSVYQGCMEFDGKARWEEMVAAMEAVLDIDDLIGPRDAHIGKTKQAPIK
ncbi:MAG: hypothetical protein HKN14_05345 [Marinicaulis sp.]|nr:hypothetical protein [Marinicaulis sp.]NNE40327.1 hypothetical protein [Marinicaulis sp.]NNL88211.1 hypothetical protein [Marinicaulis sp.]